MGCGTGLTCWTLRSGLSLTYTWTSLLPSLSNDTLYTRQEGWIAYAQNALQAKKPPVVFQFLLSSATGALGVTCTSPSASVVIDVDIVALDVSTKIVLVAKKLLSYSHTPYKPVAVLVLKRKHPSTISGSPKKRCQKTATELTFAVVKE